MARGTVRSWSDDDGWGVLDSADTPGGCWAHFSAVQVAGHRSLTAGQAVELEWERAEQDGFAHRAVRVRPLGAEPVAPVGAAPAQAYVSSLTLTFDDGDGDGGDDEPDGDGPSSTLSR